MIEMVSNGPLAIAAALSAITAAIHVFLGGPDVAAPLLASDMRRVPKLTNYYCWHIVTITLIAMSVGFGLSAALPEERLLALIWTVIAFAFTIWSVALVLWKKMSPIALPQWALFAPIAGCGAWGLL